MRTLTKMQNPKLLIFLVSVLVGLNACDHMSDEDIHQFVTAETKASRKATRNTQSALPIYDDLEGLPQDLGLGKGGKIDTVYKNQVDGISYGYMMYKPTGYDSNTNDYPVWIHLHGKGKKGNSAKRPSDLLKVQHLGPANLIKKKNWNPRYPVLVATPQTSGGWREGALRKFIKHLIEVYRINPKRIYISGNSLGAGGAWSFVSKYGDNSLCAAIVPICGNGKFEATNFRNMPVWAFHGEDDPTISVQHSIDHVNDIKALGDVTYEPKLTIYPNVKHDSWTRTFDETGMGQESSLYDPYDMNLLEWFLQYQK